MASSLLVACALHAPSRSPAACSSPRLPLPLPLLRLPHHHLLGTPIFLNSRSQITRLAAPAGNSHSQQQEQEEQEQEQEEEEGENSCPVFDIARLELYTERVPSEVLRVHALVDGEEDQVLIFKGFSSSLMRATAYDPAEPVLPPSATIRAIDRIRGPYNPAKVLLIKGGRGLSWPQFQALLQAKGL